MINVVPPADPGSNPYPYFTQSSPYFTLIPILLTLYISRSDAVDMTEIYQWVGGTDIGQYYWEEEIANIKEIYCGRFY